ncbi:hypothetical protein M427DRAFT_462310 [Gonapodya prolifera JEL478]|uniref:Uncharacterized protein n=1 Tax=Gonapodya prolifera (strain JEL478) TaxID=1344416 RepID=A0A139A366_GONPJ|nr:hypothetical protein M427DRAFT_462310 [Gonapodya prolifera JEL478]|eukprot:KXS10823.1 hypothetical protein M427DRAFT_462310 [Gonapodya prolifera JEL478]
MSSSLNAELIDAVEAGNVAEVQRIIEAGASPEAWKKVTLMGKVKRGRGPFGGFDWKEDTVDGENALMLAILHGKVGVVKMLLEKGARVDCDVDWKIASCNGNRNWNPDEWKRQRWDWTLSFPSLVCLGMGQGGLATYWSGYADGRPNGYGQLFVNFRGGNVIVRHPKSWKDHSVWVTLQTRPRDRAHPPLTRCDCDERRTESCEKVSHSGI